MADLISTLRDIQSGIRDPGMREISLLTLDLLAKQIRQSWQTRTDENQDAWVGLKQPSFAGVLKRNRLNLLWHKEKRGKDEDVFYIAGEGQQTQHSHESYTPTESFIEHKAFRAIRESKITDEGFETDDLPRYGMWQTDGTDKTGWGGPIPERSFWAFGDDILDLVADILAEKAARKVAGGA